MINGAEVERNEGDGFAVGFLGESHTRIPVLTLGTRMFR